MGHYRSDRSTYVPVPALLAGKLEAGLVADKKGAVLLVEPAWPAPHSTHMMRLSSLIDGDRGADAVGKQLARIQKQYPVLGSVHTPQSMLDRLSTQLPQRVQAATALPAASAGITKAGGTAEKGDAQLENRLDTLENNATQQSHKGFLDVLGESGELDKPKKKRIKEEVKPRNRLR